MNDDHASATVQAVLELAVAVRDEGPDQVARAARMVLAAAGGDPLAALTVAAALIRVDQPVDAWWQHGLDGIGAPADVEAESAGPACEPAMTLRAAHAAFTRHKAAREQPCSTCVVGEREYQRDRHQAQRAAKRDAERAELAERFEPVVGATVAA